MLAAHCPQPSPHPTGSLPEDRILDLLARYLDAIGGRLEITAAFDDGAERVVLDWPAA